jgi:hypothetical protein
VRDLGVVVDPGHHSEPADHEGAPLAANMRRISDQVVQCNGQGARARRGAK